MCFTVAIIRNNTLLTTEKYYNSLPDVWDKKPDLPEFDDYYFVSGFTHPELPILTNKGILMHEWGLIPSWTTDVKAANLIRTKTLNAVGETIFDKPSFRKSIINQRCILPVTGFYEWREVNGVKFPYFVFNKNNEGFYLGSIYDSWIDNNSGKVRNTFSIVTTPANLLMEKIHNSKKRMPLILSAGNEYKWLESSLSANEIKSLIQPFDDNKMEAYTVSRLANNVRNDRNVPEMMNFVNQNIIETENQLKLF